MNIRRCIVSMLFVCVLLSACVPTATSMPPVPTTLSPTQTAAAILSVDLNQVPDITPIPEPITLDISGDRVPIFAFGSIWILADTIGTLSRWDPETHQLQATIDVGDPRNTPYGDPFAAVATDEALWVTAVAMHEIVKIDPATNQIVQHIAIPDGDNFFTNRMVLAGNTVWVWDYNRKTAQGIDLSTGQDAGTLHNVQSLASFEDSLWVSNPSAISEVDPVTNQFVKELPVTVPLPVFSAHGSIWGFSSAAIFRRDPLSDQISTRIRFNTPIRDVKFAGGSVWLTVSPGAPPACHTGSYLVQVDPNTNTAIGKIAMDCPFDIILYKDGLWVAGGDGSHMLLSYVQP